MEQQSLHTVSSDAVSQSQIVPYGTPTIKVVGNFDAPTLRLAKALVQVAHYFHTLFPQQLSPYYISLNENYHCKGYYKPNAWLVDSSTNLPEINIHPSLFWLEPIDVMQTLVHELCHHYHQIYGTPGKDGYHNVAFSKIMASVGLECSDTGKPGGRKTGRRMTHYIIQGGAFEQAFNQMPEEYKIPFKPIIPEATSVDDQTTQRLKQRKEQKLKTKYTCLDCGAVAWAKANQFFICGNCQTRLTVIDDMGK